MTGTSSHARLRSQIVPQADAEAAATEKPKQPARKSKYIPWAELLHRTFGFECVCARPIGVLVALAVLQTVMVAGLAIRIVQVGRVDLDVRWLGLLPLAGAIVAWLAIRRGSKPRAVRVAVLVFSLAVAGFLAVAHQRGRPAVAAGARR